MSELRYRTGQLDRLQQTLASPQAQPSSVGRYRVLEPLGEGGMGAVYKARQLAPIERIVALKLIRFELDGRDVVNRFESDRQALAWMDHPNVARVLDAGSDPVTGRPYVVMEYVPGEPITRFCDEHRLTIRQRLELFVQVCEAVAHAHQKMIVHRDLKPSNILVMRLVYDPSRGRFRAYLKTCAHHALGRICGSLAPPQDVPVEEMPLVDDRDDEHLWERLAAADPSPRDGGRARALHAQGKARDVPRL
jgi:hypothetical protein